MGKCCAENLSEMLLLLKADALLCNEISPEYALEDKGISFYSGFERNTNNVVQGFISGIYPFE